MPATHEMMYRKIGPFVMVHGHDARTVCCIVGIYQHIGYRALAQGCALLAVATGGCHQYAINSPALQKGEIERLFLRAAVRVAQDDTETLVVSAVLDTTSQLRVKWVGNIHNDEANRPRVARPDSSCQQVRLVAHLAGHRGDV